MEGKQTESGDLDMIAKIASKINSKAYLIHYIARKVKDLIAEMDEIRLKGNLGLEMCFDLDDFGREFLLDYTNIMEHSKSLMNSAGYGLAPRVQNAKKQEDGSNLLFKKVYNIGGVPEKKRYAFILPEILEDEKEDETKKDDDA